MNINKNTRLIFLNVLYLNYFTPATDEKNKYFVHKNLH